MTYPFSRGIIPLSALPHNAEVSRLYVSPRSYSEDGLPREWGEDERGYAAISMTLKIKVWRLV